MASERCPGKALMELLRGEPLLAILLNRLKTSRAVDEVAFATSTLAENDVLADLARTRGFPVFRGDENDVLMRHRDAMRAFDARNVVRVTGDNPLTDIETMDSLVDLHHARRADYTYVPGPALLMGILSEVISRDAIERSWDCGEAKHRSELVTLFIKENPDQFGIATMDLDPALLRPGYRLTVDHPEDVRLQRELFAELGERRGRGIHVNTKDAIALLDARPDLVAINAHLTHKSVNLRSVELDRNIRGT
jgi:spore coat polysaccharide biosynthesis protein SpsF